MLLVVRTRQPLAPKHIIIRPKIRNKEYYRFFKKTKLYFYKMATRFGLGVIDQEYDGVLLSPAKNLRNEKAPGKTRRFSFSP